MPAKRSIFPVFLSIAFIIFPVFLNAQSKPIALPINSNGQIEYIENIIVPKTDQSILFGRAMHWIVGTRSYKFKKLDLMDKDFGRLGSSGVFLIDHDEVLLTVLVDVKDNKAILKVRRFDYNMSEGNVAFDNLTNKASKEAQMLIPKVAQSMKVFIKSFKDALSGTSGI